MKKKVCQYCTTSQQRAPLYCCTECGGLAREGCHYSLCTMAERERASELAELALESLLLFLPPSLSSCVVAGTADHWAVHYRRQRRAPRTTQTGCRLRVPPLRRWRAHPTFCAPRQQNHLPTLRSALPCLPRRKRSNGGRPRGVTRRNGRVGILRVRLLRHERYATRSIAVRRRPKRQELVRQR